MTLFAERMAGLVAHITSLPGPNSSGVLGDEAFRFVDFLAACGFSVWQVLPLGPTHSSRSPYQSQSVHAGEPSLISFESALMTEHLGFAPGCLQGHSAGEPDAGLLAALAAEFQSMAGSRMRSAYRQFCQRSGWLSDFALFRVLRAQFDEAPWWEWPSALANREITALAKARNKFRDAIEVERFAQFLFFTQWNALRNHASRAGIRLFGDLPIFVAHDSADVWAERKYFKLDRRGQPSVVAGVPPDYFSEDGQLWGNPLYAWRVHADDNFRWWTRRIETQLALYDLFRIDHFRGFAAHWEIPADARTAKGGKWVTGPGEQFFTALREEFGPLPLVAEDLGVITPDVATLLEAVGVPGMKVMQFAFGGGATNPYLPENHVDNCVVYSGTHDNDTTHAWFETLSPSEKQDVAKALHVEPMALPEAVIDAALGSCAKLAMLPLQDVLGLGAGHRMNTPGTVDGNWSWRVRSDQLTPAVCEATRAKLHTHGRILSEAEAAESSPAKQVRAGS